MFFECTTILQIQSVYKQTLSKVMVNVIDFIILICFVAFCVFYLTIIILFFCASLYFILFFFCSFFYFFHVCSQIFGSSYQLRVLYIIFGCAHVVIKLKSFFPQMFWQGCGKNGSTIAVSLERSRYQGS